LFSFFEYHFIIQERPTRDRWIRALIRSRTETTTISGDKPVVQIGGGLPRIHRSGLSFSCSLTFDGTRVSERQNESRREHQQNRNLKDSHLLGSPFRLGASAPRKSLFAYTVVDTRILEGDPRYPSGSISLTYGWAKATAVRFAKVELNKQKKKRCTSKSVK